MKKPRALSSGCTIGLVSPASPNYRLSEVTRCAEYLEAKGYKVALGKNVNKSKGIVAGTEEERADDINEMFADDGIDAVCALQGGYGSAQLIDHIDFDLISSNPKVFTGFSDITSLHLALGKLSGIVTFHGPGIARFNPEDLTEYTERQFFKAVGDKRPLGSVELADKKKWLQCICGGRCSGLITGGNLTLICSSIGTRYEIDTKGKLLLFEDVDTEPWIFDHMMCHLRNSGKLSEAAGFIIGECENCEPRKCDPGFYSDYSIEDVLDYYLKPLGKPALYGLPLGHTKDLATIPMGVMAELDADAKTFTITEGSVI